MNILIAEPQVDGPAGFPGQLIKAVGKALGGDHNQDEAEKSKDPLPMGLPLFLKALSPTLDIKKRAGARPYLPFFGPKKMSAQEMSARDAFPHFHGPGIGEKHLWH